MKRSALERHLRDHGAELVREGARHSVWAIGDRETERIAAVPRHREIKVGTVRAICKALEIPPPTGSRCAPVATLPTEASIEASI